MPKMPLPEQTVVRFTLDAYAEGVKDWSLTAPRADLFETMNRIDVKRPTVQFFERGRPGSVMDAGAGIVHTDTQDMRAWAGVVMVSTDGARVESDWLDYKNKEERLISTAPVTIVRGGSVTRGVGWEASPDLSEIIIRQQTVEIEDKDMPRRKKQ